MMGRLGPFGAERVLVNALTTEDGPVILAEVCRLFTSVSDRPPIRPPHRLEELRDECRALLLIDPDPAAVGWTRRRLSSSSVEQRPAARVPTSRPSPRAGVAGSGPVVARPIQTARTRARVAPPSPPSGITPNEPLSFPPLLAAVHGDEPASGLRLVLPRTTSELVAWGRGCTVASVRSVRPWRPVAASCSVSSGTAPSGTAWSCHPTGWSANSWGSATLPYLDQWPLPSAHGWLRSVCCEATVTPTASGWKPDRPARGTGIGRHLPSPDPGRGGCTEGNFVRSTPKSRR